MEEFILKMFDKVDRMDIVESQKELKKLTDSKGKYYAMHPKGEPMSESERLEKQMRDDIHKQWIMLIKDRPDLQEKYGVKFVDNGKNIMVNK